MRIRALPDIDAIERPHYLLLSLSRFRCLAPARRTDLPQPPDPPRSSRSGRMDRDRQAARRAPPDPERARPPAGGRPPHRSDKASPRWASARSRSAAKEHRAPTPCLPRRPSFARRVAPPHARVASARVRGPRRVQSIADQTTDRTAYLRLAETLTAFLA